MDATETRDIAAFRAKYGMHSFNHPTFCATTLEERAIYLQEEFDELQAATASGDLLEVADALVDMVYIIKGTAAALGMADAWPAMWAEVHRANMSKRLATSADMSKRGLVGDVFKPDGWTPPDIAGALHSRPPSVVHSSILAEAYDIMDRRGQEADRQYGPMQEGMDKAASVASVLAGRPITADTVMCALVGLKLSREHYSHKRDNLLDAVAYLSALNDRREANDA